MLLLKHCVLTINLLLSQREYVLLCGPVDEEIYEAAVASASSPTNSSSTISVEGTATSYQPPARVLEVERVGIHATRLQIDSLTAQIEELDLRHQELILELDEQNQTSDAALLEARAEITKLREEMEQCRVIIRTLEAERRRSILSRHVSEIFREKLQKLSIENVVALVRLTSMVRGFLGRARVKRIKASQIASEVGILSALANTIQGRDHLLP